ncbi:uncharacterized protein SPSC_00089 [Sporisorium scitamineum]|uniref:Uncharacterized protein n=1 Tax=Sporisorium scitamineum TaxID=49012 RepID=A0A127Z5C4_9BASI|nr:uncharacterized protein SPSC_00089 [Sporisorium scitamineum]
MKKPTTVFLHSLFLVLCAVAVTALPPLPAGVSQVEAAIALADKSKFSQPLSATELGEKLYSLSVLEGDPSRPFAIKQQLQSQAFYRMMADRYAHFRPDAKGLPVFVAHRRFDELVDRYWEAFSAEYVLKYKERVHRELDWYKHDKQEYLKVQNPEIVKSRMAGWVQGAIPSSQVPGSEKSQEALTTFFTEQELIQSPSFMTHYQDLPDEKRTAIKYLDNEVAGKLFHVYLINIYETAAREHILSKFSSEDPNTLRRFSNVEGSSSRSPWYGE